MRQVGRFARWSVVILLLLGTGVGAFVWTQLDDQIRRLIEKRLADHYTGFSVRVRFAQRVEGEGIVVRDLTLHDLRMPAGSPPMLAVEELLLKCPADLASLAQGEPQVQRIIVRRPRLRAMQLPDGTWDAARLWPPPRLSESPADVEVEGGTVEIRSGEAQTPRILVLRECAVVLDEPADPGVLPRSRDPRRLRGSFLGDHHQRFEFEGAIDLESDLWQIAGLVDGLRISPELFEALPPKLAGPLSYSGAIRAQSRFSFSASHDRWRDPPRQFEISGDISHGRLDDPRLPYPLMDLKADLHATHEGLQISNLTAQNGATSLRLSCTRQGYGAESPLEVVAHCQRLKLDRHLAGFLPAQLRSQWENFQPSGEVDLTLRVQIQGARWRPDLTLECHDVGLIYAKFPYPMSHLRGQVALKNNHLRFDLSQGEGPAQTRLEGAIDQPGPNFTGVVTVSAVDAAYDERLAAALDEASRRVVESFNPSGRFDLDFRLWREPGAGPTLHRQALISLRGCSVKYRHFPYPIEDIQGQLQMRDGDWRFLNLRGANDAGQVTCSGHFQPGANGKELFLRLSGRDIPLEDELREAIGPARQRVWDELRPRGAIHLLTDIRYFPAQKRLALWTRVEPIPEVSSIEPRCLPLRFEQLRGSFVYQDGQVTIENLRGEYGRTTIATRGACQIDPDGSWQLRLRDLSVDRLRPDRDVLRALPERLRGAVTALNFSGPLSLTGQLDFLRESSPGSPVRSEWDLTLETNQGSMTAGIRLDSIEGGVRLVGDYDGTQFRCRGELDMDSVMYKQWQFTDLAGPVWIDDRRILLGKWVEKPAAGERERHITARFCGGQVVGDGWVALGGNSRYAVQGSLAAGDLAIIASQTGARGDLAGKVYAQIDLRGAGKEIHNLRGRGAMQLRDANVYELPVMVSLLKLLSVRSPDRTAFTKSDIEFRMEGPHIYFDRIDFNGDAISLLGAGEMNLDQEIRLTFHSIVGKGDFRLPVLRELLGGASQQTMQIHIGGTLKEPETRFEPFPALNQALQQLQVDLQPPGMRIGP